MRLWDALSSAMSTSLDRRIGSREAEQLLNADSNGATYPDLSRLLASAAAPPRRDELIDLRAAVIAFEAAGQDGELSCEAIVAMPRRRRVLADAVAVQAAAGVAVVLFGGVALAAETGSLPSGAQQHAHNVFSVLGVPPPTTAPAPPAPSARQVTPTALPSTADRGQTSPPAAPAALGLCRSWDARQKNAEGSPMQSEALRALAAAAGGAEHIATFCASLLAGDHSPATTHEPPTVGKGHAHTTHTPNPHKKG